MIAFDPTISQWLNLILAVILPVLVGLVTTKVTSPTTKAVLLAALSLVAGLGTQLLAAVQAGTTYDLSAGLFAGIATFIIAVASHVGLWKPTGVSAAAQSVGTTQR